MLRPGDTAPDFTLPLATADGRATFRLRDALGGGPLVFEFFPHAFSGTCTQQLCDVRDARNDLAALHAQVYGFSHDSHHVNSAYIRHHGLGFPIICDANREVLPRVWELQAVSGVERVAKRGVLVLDDGGVARHVWATEDPDVKPDVAELRAILAEMADAT